MTAVIVLSVREWPALLMASTLMSVRIPPGALGTRLISTSLLRRMPLSERRQSQWLMQRRSLPGDQLSAERIKDQATRIGLVVEVEHVHDRPGESVEGALASGFLGFVDALEAPIILDKAQAYCRVYSAGASGLRTWLGQLSRSRAFNG